MGKESSSHHFSPERGCLVFCGLCIHLVFVALHHGLRGIFYEAGIL